MRVANPWHALPREAVNAPCWKNQGQVRQNCEQPCLVKGVPVRGRGKSCLPTTLRSVILWVLFIVAAIVLLLLLLPLKIYWKSLNECTFVPVKMTSSPSDRQHFHKSRLQERKTIKISHLVYFILASLQVRELQVYRCHTSQNHHGGDANQACTWHRLLALRGRIKQHFSR